MTEAPTQPAPHRCTDNDHPASAKACRLLEDRALKWCWGEGFSAPKDGTERSTTIVTSMLTIR